MTDNDPLDFTVIDSFRKTSKGNKKIYWIPYLQRIEKVFKTKNIWEVYYNGGSVLIDMLQTDAVMLYGISEGNIPLEFLNDALTLNVLLIVHKRNSAKTGIYVSSCGIDTFDMLTSQIYARSNSKKRIHIAKQLIKGQIQGRTSIVGTYVSESFIHKLQSMDSVDKIRNLEAQATAKYWRMFFYKLNLKETRREKGIVQQALNAGSIFLVGILLRWCIYHKLSPHHGFLHTTTKYVSLVYDLIEPFRYLIEKALLNAYSKTGSHNLIATTIFEIKMILDETVFTNTRQRSKIKTMLHGEVLSLCAYLKGSQRTFINVRECTPSQAMKKPKFRLPGPPASKT